MSVALFGVALARVFKLIQWVDPFFIDDSGLLTIGIGFVYGLLSFELRPINKLTNLSLVFMYLVLGNFLIAYLILLQSDLELGGVFLLIPIFLLSPLSLLFLIAGLIKGLFAKNPQSS